MAGMAGMAGMAVWGHSSFSDILILGFQMESRYVCRLNPCLRKVFHILGNVFNGQGAKARHSIANDKQYPI